MGEHTIREVLKRRSSATQRELQKRRDQIVRNRRSRAPLLVLAVVVVAIAGTGIYVGSLASKISNRFNADLVSRSADPVHNLSLHSVSAFLPNTLLAVTDPGFFDASATTISPVTRRLVQLYFPDASTLSINIMALVAQFRFTRTDILEGYLNDAHMGMDNDKPITGLVAASQIYFRKPIADLQPQDIALLVAMIGNPQQNDPRRFPDKALASRNAVLRADVDQTVLSQDQANVLSRTPLGVAP
jgi:hypothetical protein